MEEYNREDYLHAIYFLLNYPRDKVGYFYNVDKDIYEVYFPEEVSLPCVNLIGKLVRSALKYKGEKEWIGITIVPCKECHEHPCTCKEKVKEDNEREN